jgi:hypothetical protein
VAITFLLRIACVPFALGAVLFAVGTAPAYACDPHTGAHCEIVPDEGFVISDGPTHPDNTNVIADIPPLDAGHPVVVPAPPLPPECNQDVIDMTLWVMLGCGPFLP